MDFVAIDVETANPDMASICQIGIAKYANNELVEEWSSLVNPQDDFDPYLVAIHGIAEQHVKDAPTFPEIADELRTHLGNRISVCHTHFDRVSVGRACEKYGIEHIETTWLDSACVSRRTWKECAYGGYGLANVCEMIGYDFKHHDALEDAKAAAQVLIAARKESGLDIEGWLKRVRQPIDPSVTSSSSSRIAKDGNPDGPLFGEVLVFTGTLSLVRREAADLAASVGCTVARGVTKTTTLLVVGDQDIRVLAGHNKSSKHRKAEDLIARGQKIRILQESDFKELVKLA